MSQYKIPIFLEKLITKFSQLPGIGPKSAIRLSLYMLRMPQENLSDFASILNQIHESIKKCRICGNLCDQEECVICLDDLRNRNQIMVVEDFMDVVTIESLDEYKGVYHVLGGVLSPLNAIGPDDLNMLRLFNRIQEFNIDEIIIATNPNLEGEATALYIKEQIIKLNQQIKISRLARGLPTNADLEYADKLTLSRSLSGRIQI